MIDGAMSDRLGGPSPWCTWPDAPQTGAPLAQLCAAGFNQLWAIFCGFLIPYTQMGKVRWVWAWVRGSTAARGGTL
jgi:hypothetical protein